MYNIEYKIKSIMKPHAAPSFKIKTINYLFNPKWEHSKVLFENTEYTITEFSQICPMFKCKNSNKKIGSVVINGRLWYPKSEGSSPLLFKTTDSYIFNDGIINVNYSLNNKSSIFPPNNVLSKKIASGCSGKYALIRGSVILKTDNSNTRVVKFKYENIMKSG
jgi:hypothetical protein